MKRSLHLFICDILENIELIENSTDNMTKEKFESNKDIVDATIRRIEVIGEAVKNLPNSFREKHSNIPWKDMADDRDLFKFVNTGDVYDIVLYSSSNCDTSHPCLSVQGNIVGLGNGGDYFIDKRGTANKIEVVYGICGNNIIEQGEQCDDGNIINGDGCSSSCQIETPQCTSGADTIIIDGFINQDELNNYIQQYYLGNVNIDKLSNVIVEHLNGCG